MYEFKNLNRLILKDFSKMILCCNKAAIRKHFTGGAFLTSGAVILNRWIADFFTSKIMVTKCGCSRGRTYNYPTATKDTPSSKGRLERSLQIIQRINQSSFRFLYFLQIINRRFNSKETFECLIFTSFWRRSLGLAPTLERSIELKWKTNCWKTFNKINFAKLYFPVFALDIWILQSTFEAEPNNKLTL